MVRNEPPDPHHLLRLARVGCGLARGQLLELYRNYLVVLAGQQLGRRLQGKCDADDLVQETLLQAHQCLDQFLGGTEAELLAWLRAILASRIAKLIRRYGTQRRDVGLERDLEDELGQSSRVLSQDLAAPHSSPSHQAVRREQEVRMADALARLPKHYREVLVLRHFEGLPFPEVAGRLAARYVAYSTCGSEP